MPPFRSRLIDLTPWVRGPGSGVGLTAWHSFHAIHRLEPSVVGASRIRGSMFRWINPIERLMGKRRSLYHSFEHRMPSFINATRVLSIHDLWTLQSGNSWQHPSFQERQAPLLEQAIRRAHWITTPSRAVLRELQERFPETKGRSQCVPWGPTTPLNIQNSDEIHQRPFERPYFLTVANFETRKNLPFILEAIRGLSGFDWVFAGRPGFGAKDVLEKLHSFAASSKIQFHFLQDLPSEKLVALYHHCEAVVLPSFAEGFGLPALEGATLSRPLVLSNIEAFREIAIDSALYFDPIHGSEALRAHLLQLLEDHSLSRKMSAQASLRAQLFTWEKTASQFLSIYGKLESS